MEYEKYRKTLKELKITIKEFSAMINTSYGTVIKWGKDGRAVPDWVETWLQLYSDKKKLEEKLKALKENDCEEYKKALAKALLSSLSKEK
ncbi:hypothetical protein KKC13_00805 [bacterium]|nr:hypothetical protein [bacterium]MBU1959223.1 hypothetical protein [bacterium]